MECHAFRDAELPGPGVLLWEGPRVSPRLERGLDERLP